MDELTLDDQKYLSSKRAAQVTGYAKDYVGQLCREGRVKARLVGRNWYVLESSILEHRFGAEEADVEVNTAKEPENATIASTWEAPRYIPEPPQTVPELTPKTVEVRSEVAQTVDSGSETLESMQNAWQEWFQRQEKEEKMLPDASEMLLESPEEETLSPEQAQVEQEDSAEEVVPVHIARIETPTELKKAPEPASVPITRSYVQPVLKSNNEEPMTRMRRGRPVGQARRRKQGNAALVRSLFIAVAILACAVTAIGSGFADSYLVNNWSAPITDIISGVKNISK